MPGSRATARSCSSTCRASTACRRARRTSASRTTSSRARWRAWPKPDAVLLILDSTNLNRHLVLAAPILALGLPTLVVLNMADELSSRGGAVDAAALATSSARPSRSSARRKGEGLETVREFLSGAVGVPPSLDLPVLADIPKCRQWAVAMGDEASYAAPAPPVWTRRLDAVFLHPVAGPLVFLAVVVAVFQTIFSAARPLMDAVDHAVSASGAWLSALLPASLLQVAAARGRVGRRRLGRRLPAADPAALPLHRPPRGLRLPRARRAHRRPHDAEGGPSGEVVPPAALGLRVRRAGRPGHPHDREQARPHRDDPHRAVHDVLGAAARLHADHRGLPARASAARPVPRHARGRDARPLRARLPRGLRDGAAPEVVGPEERPGAVPARDAALPPAHAAADRPEDVRPVEDLPPRARAR